MDEYRLFPQWDEGLKQELSGWKGELDKLDAKIPDEQLVYNNALAHVIQALEATAKEAGMLPDNLVQLKQPVLPSVASEIDLESDNRGLCLSLSQLYSLANVEPDMGFSFRPMCFVDPIGNEIPVGSWADSLRKFAEWLIDKGLLHPDKCSISLTQRGSRYLIHSSPIHQTAKHSVPVANCQTAYIWNFI